MFIELRALRNIFPGPVSSKNVVITNSKLELKELYDVKTNNGEVFVELIEVLKRNEEENDMIDMTDDASTSSTAKTALKKYFGHETFQLLQKETIEATLVGQSVLTVVGTGGGKT